MFSASLQQYSMVCAQVETATSLQFCRQLALSSTTNAKPLSIVNTCNWQGYFPLTVKLNNIPET